jgi:glyoxylase-like metal-dependent hydrolase (beta-lactamase superfamily II)
MTPNVEAFPHRGTFTIAYVVFDRPGGRAAVIDSVLDFDAKSGRVATEAADEIAVFVGARDLTVDWILETHAHADYLTAAPYLKQKLGGKIAIGARIAEVQATFKALFNAGDDFAADGSQFDRLFADDERFSIGEIEGRVLHTPGHTPACITYHVGDAAFVGDTIYMPGFGTAWADFPGGDAATLYRSIQQLLALPGETRLFMCHDYGPGGRAVAWETTVAEERAGNVHVHDGIDEAAFVEMRKARGATLEVPALMLPALQVNMRAGELPPPEDNGVSYLKLPLNVL